MDVLSFIQQHWLGWVGWAAAGSVGWLGTNAIGKPVLELTAARMAALQALERHWSVGPMASEERARAASEALGTAAAALQALAAGAGPAARLYCRAMNYDLATAAGALRGLTHVLVDGHPNDRERQADAIRVCLGATRGMPRSRLNQIREDLRRLGQRAEESPDA